MKQQNTTQDEFFDGNIDMNNIIRINNITDDTEDSDDYDFDYDPNEMYYALNGKN